MGIWDSDEDDLNSNFYELCNHVTALEQGVRNLANAEVFLFTYNFTAESVFYKGNSPVGDCLS